jgi:hypothetical protein
MVGVRRVRMVAVRRVGVRRVRMMAVRRVRMMAVRRVPVTAGPWIVAVEEELAAAGCAHAVRGAGGAVGVGIDGSYNCSLHEQGFV